MDSIEVIDLSTDEESDNEVTCIDCDEEFIEEEAIACEAHCSYSSQQINGEHFQYEILTTEQITDTMLECIREVNAVVQLPTAITRILLNHFKWDKEKLFERYYGGDRNELFKEAHVFYNSKMAAVGNGKETKKKWHNCTICFEDVGTAGLIGLECGHKFCKDCWTQYLTTKIMEDGVGNNISCIAHGCDILVDDSTVFSLISDTNVRLRYQIIITNSFVNCNKLLRWCPNPLCSHIVKAEFSDFQRVKCTCGTSFCFKCGDNWHEPINCDLLKKWLKKCEDDSETKKWILTNTKSCPMCNVNIEKNGGCNYVRCSSCQTGFCWFCLQPTSNHYCCNVYGINPDDVKQRSRVSLEKYLFYFERYMNHKNSLQLETKLHSVVVDKMNQMQTKYNKCFVEVQFLKKAVEVLNECRQTLMYSYVFAHYVTETSQKMIFEDNQRDLQENTEMLSEYLERELTDDYIDEIKQKVQDKYKYCEERRNVLVQHVQEGYDSDFWDFIVETV